MLDGRIQTPESMEIDSCDSSRPHCSLVWAEPAEQDEKTACQRCVRFDEKRNLYHDAHGYIIDEDIKQLLWYDHRDFQLFRSSLWASSQALMLSAPEHSSKMWVETLAAIYTSKITVSTVPQRILAEVYSQADDLVGLEYYMLNPTCQADASARKSAIRGALRLTTRTSVASSIYKRRHLSVLSRRLSQTSQRFAHEIANAQSQALSWTQ
mmetsp:Transcript_21866/g.28299  ORF Transcript_21866/g.28299 Transcript_21866/m.28299 type:complete len:210 (-) Transcript_21866:554-1183(-)